MKNLKINTFAAIAVYVMLSFVVFCGCDNTKERTIAEPPPSNEYSVVIIDNCEYLQYYVDLKYGNAYTTSDYQTKMITHKGNCVFCADRVKNDSLIVCLKTRNNLTNPNTTINYGKKSRNHRTNRRRY